MPIAIVEGERRKFLGSSEIPALFERVLVEDVGATDSMEEDAANALNENEMENEQDVESASPYTTPYALWAYKSGLIKKQPRKETDRIRWGIKLEKMAADALAEREGWTIRVPSARYLHDTVDRMGAVLDFEANDGTDEWVPLEMKTVADDQRYMWKNAIGELIVPMHIMLQVQHQISVMNTEYAYLGVLFGGSELKYFLIEKDQEMIDLICEAVVEFWRRVDENEPYEADFERDSKILTRLSNNINPQSVLDWRDDIVMRNLIVEFKELGAQESAIKKRRTEIRTAIVTSMGENGAANLGDAIATLKMIPGQEYTVVREPYKKLHIGKPQRRHAGNPLET